MADKGSSCMETSSYNIHVAMCLPLQSFVHIYVPVAAQEYSCIQAYLVHQLHVTDRTDYGYQSLDSILRMTPI